VQRAPRPGGARDAEARAATKVELTGLASVYRLYQRYRETHGLEIAYAANTISDGSELLRDTTQSDALSRQLEAALPAYGFATIRDFEAKVAQYERDFEAGAAEVVFALLDRYTAQLSAEAARLRDPGAVRALHGQLGGFRGHQQAQEQAVGDHQRVVMSMQFGWGATKPTGDDVARAGQRVVDEGAGAERALGDLGAANPVLRDDGLPADKRLDRSALARATPEQLGPLLHGHLAERLADLAQARGRIAGDRRVVYQLDQLFPQFYAALGVAPGSIFDLIIADKRRQLASDKLIDAVLLAVLALALSVVSLGTATPALAAAAGVAGAGLGGYGAYLDYQDYVEQNDLADVGFTDRASTGWLIVSMLGAGLDAAGAAKAVSALRAASNALEATNDATAFAAAVRQLQDAGRLEARAAEAAVRAAAARVGARHRCDRARRNPHRPRRLVPRFPRRRWLPGRRSPRSQDPPRRLRHRRRVLQPPPPPAQAEVHRRAPARGARRRQARLGRSQGRPPRRHRRSRGRRGCAAPRILGSQPRRAHRERAPQGDRPGQAAPRRRSHSILVALPRRRRARPPPPRSAPPGRQGLPGRRRAPAVPRRPQARRTAGRAPRRRTPARDRRHDQTDLGPRREVPRHPRKATPATTTSTRP
jgi:hypothetical protein